MTHPDLASTPTTPITGKCPFPHGTNQRKTFALPAYDTPISIDENGVWHVRGYREVRQILRSDTTKQAGFLAEGAAGQTTTLSNPPMLYREGEPHQQQRRKTAKFFTPKYTETYRDLMNDYADQLIEKLTAAGQADLSRLSMDMAVKVAAQIVGLTNSRIGGMARRIERMLSLDENSLGWSPANLWKMANTQIGTFSFFFLDVKPAIHARRENPQDDLISHLISEGYSDAEILVESITFGAAGMVTTREFIAVALLHCLENATYRDLMLTAEQEARYNFLHEILRLEPVVGSLYRRTTAPLTIETDGEERTIPADTLLALDIYAANADETVVGEAPHAVCPERDMAAMRPAVQPFVMGFGDGTHRCPGAYVAIQETDIFLRKLLALDSLRIDRPPSITRNLLVKGYEIRDFIIHVG